MTFSQTFTRAIEICVWRMLQKLHQRRHWPHQMRQLLRTAQGYSPSLPGIYKGMWGYGMALPANQFPVARDARPGEPLLGPAPPGPPPPPPPHTHTHTHTTTTTTHPTHPPHGPDQCPLGPATSKSIRPHWTPQGPQAWQPNPHWRQPYWQPSLPQGPPWPQSTWTWTYISPGCPSCKGRDLKADTGT